ncbi:MAG TPA: hypothetical protein VGO04_12065 [Ensifer sp.]|jgi:hypothetical protein|uniref:hypothetical protein n=1 Tax=Ensifer sp. TaxID=1872086 RepID=UPI002E1157A5|nr:hypothetical protein [Ensifer sp.]
MEYVQKLIQNPFVSLVFALVISFGFAKYSYKINYFTKARYKKYLIRKIVRTKFVLFGRRDAFIVAVLLRAALITSSAALLATLMTCFYLSTLHQSSFQSEGAAKVARWGLMALVAAGAFLHFGGIVGLMRELQVLLNPTHALYKLRREIKSSDKRELLADSEVAHFDRLLDLMEADLPKLSRMSIVPGAEPDEATLPPIPEGESVATVPRSSAEDQVVSKLS